MGKSDHQFKPLIQYTIETALRLNIFEAVYVSTDSEEIASISSDIGAKVPFIRPDSLATDKSSSIEVMKHAISWLYEKEDLNFETVHPTQRSYK